MLMSLGKKVLASQFSLRILCDVNCYIHHRLDIDYTSHQLQRLSVTAPGSTKGG